MSDRYSEKELEQFNFQDPLNALNYIQQIVLMAHSRKLIDEKALGVLDDKIAHVKEFIETERTDVMFDLFGVIPEKPIEVIKE